MKEKKLPGIKIWYDDELINTDVERVFEPEYWHKQDKVLGSAQGRGTTWFVQTDTIPAALRHYRRGGLFGKLVKDKYWFNGWEKTRSFEEFHLLQYLAGQGVNVPLPIAARVVKKGFLYQADILTQKVEEANDLVDILQRQQIGDSDYYRIGQEIRKLHDANVNHTDLNIHNLLLDKNKKVWIIDFDKCSQMPKSDTKELPAWKQSNLNRLKRSFQKELTKRSIHWNSTKDWQSIESGYNS
ncbi:MAG: 3-deoxy-D-manno-octulosonic acid kinase [Vibrio sp.]